MVGIKGMSDEEAQPLLQFLFRHTSRPEFGCRFRWRKGSLAFWDNRCTMHYACNDYQGRSEEHTSELQSLMRISYAVFCLKKKTTTQLHSTYSNSDNMYP